MNKTILDLEEALSKLVTGTYNLSAHECTCSANNISYLFSGSNQKLSDAWEGVGDFSEKIEDAINNEIEKIYNDINEFCVNSLFNYNVFCDKSESLISEMQTIITKYGLNWNDEYLLKYQV